VSRPQTEQSFWEKVNKGKTNQCWDWLSSCNSTGYGTVAWGGKVYVAHRVAAWLSNQVPTLEAPKNKRSPYFVLHKCDNRKCCNPKHFFIGDYTDNQTDAYRKGRKNQPKGAEHVNAKLTKEQVVVIRVLYKKGYKQVYLAKRFGVSQRVISLIVRGKSYK
jgi:hypothetical protein